MRALVVVLLVAGCSTAQPSLVVRADDARTAPHPTPAPIVAKAPRDEYGWIAGQFSVPRAEALAAIRKASRVAVVKVFASGQRCVSIADQSFAARTLEVVHGASLATVGARSLPSGFPSPSSEVRIAPGVLAGDVLLAAVEPLAWSVHTGNDCMAGPGPPIAVQGRITSWIRVDDASAAKQELVDGRS